MQGTRVLEGRLMPPPFTDTLGILTEPARLTRFESRKMTTTVMSSWKCRRTPRSIFFKSENLISLFFAASCSAAFTNLLALPCMMITKSNFPSFVGLSEKNELEFDALFNHAMFKHRKMICRLVLRNMHQ